MLGVVHAACSEFSEFSGWERGVVLFWLKGIIGALVYRRTEGIVFEASWRAAG